MQTPPLFTIKAQPMKRTLFSLLLSITCMAAVASDHFLSDPAYRANVESIFTKRIKAIGQKFYNIKGTKATAEEQEALRFLYAYMPLADITDYPTSFYASNVRASLTARKEMAWGNNVPELLFRHFVLPLRVNNEALDSARTVFYKELKERVKGMSMHDAILEVNHWCHEKVTYQPADARTSSPLATVKTATGRCGEQSTFTVAALRAIGIPARQVYTPRWAHTDDNHAWVEAWADGKWYFLGACEPEPVLNLGWFNAPASRAMLMHTRAFGDYQGPEEVMLRTANFTEINLTGNYAPTAIAYITVKDADGRLADNAKVEFKIYNYAEFYTAVTKYTDAQGRTSLSAGKGDMLVWCSKDGKYGYRKVSFGKDKDITVYLDNQMQDNGKVQAYKEDTMTIVPPAENAQLPFVSEDMRKENQIRFAHEDSIRKAYTATFLTGEQAAAISQDCAEFLVKSRGNHETIANFIKKHADNKKRVIAILKTLSDKDLRDITTEILEDNFNAKTDQVSPRVEDEMIIKPFKHYFEKFFDQNTAKKFKDDPRKLVAWVKDNIRVDSKENALHIAQTPVGVAESKLTDERSRGIFFVDVARSLDIEARKDAVTSKVQYKENGEWNDVLFDNKVQSTAPTGRLVLTYAPTAFLDNPLYYNHFTISKIVNGSPQLLNFEEGQVDMGNGTSWSNTFKDGCTLDEGTYILTTGTRMASGSVMASTQRFDIEAGKTTNVKLDIRHNTDDVSVIGSFNSETIVKAGGKDASILSQTGRGYFIVGVLGVGQEPTNHALHDIEKAKDAFEKWGCPVLLLFESEADAKKFNKEEFKSLPSTVAYAIDKDGAVRKQIAKQMKLKSETQLPMFIIADTFNRVVFVSQGYTIGLGEQMKNVFNKL